LSVNSDPTLLNADDVAPGAAPPGLSDEVALPAGAALGDEAARGSDAAPPHETETTNTMP
jgi:hypothetical protein